jgi:hypothetical protein
MIDVINKCSFLLIQHVFCSVYLGIGNVLVHTNLDVRMYNKYVFINGRIGAN